MMYGQNAVAMNEFLDDRWSAVSSLNGLGKIQKIIFMGCHYTNKFTFISLFEQPINGTSQPTVGKTLLDGRGLFVEEYMFWVCIAALLGFSLFFNGLFIAALTYLNRKYIFLAI